MKQKLYRFHGSNSNCSFTHTNSALTPTQQVPELISDQLNSVRLEFDPMYRNQWSNFPCCFNGNVLLCHFSITLSAIITRQRTNIRDISTDYLVTKSHYSWSKDGWVLKRWMHLQLLNIWLECPQMWFKQSDFCLICLEFT